MTCTQKTNQLQHAENKMGPLHSLNALLGEGPCHPSLHQLLELACNTGESGFWQNLGMSVN